MPLLTAEQLLAHPAFKSLEWDLPPTKEGMCPVAKGRGGPFNLWYEVHGVAPEKAEGVKIVWIMGLGAYRTAWKRQTRHFAHTAPNSTKYSSLVFDNRGIGKSDKPTLRYSTSEMAQDVIELLDFLGWTQPRSVFVAGISMGGMIAQEMGLLVPERIAGLGLISTAPRLVRTVPFLENLRQRINMFVPRHVDVQLDEIAKRLFSESFLLLPDEEKDADGQGFPTNGDRFAASELHKRLDKVGFTKKGFMLQAIAAGWHSKSKSQLTELGDRVGRERIVIMHGTGDRMLTFVHGQMLREELGVGEQGWKVWEGMGHVLTWECELEFNEEIEKWIGRCRGLKA